VRIVGELRKLGIDVSATLVRNLLRNAGIPPAPLACDFLTVDTVLLRRLYVLVHRSLIARCWTYPHRAARQACDQRPVFVR
jgi:hypothetical protein